MFKKLTLAVAALALGTVVALAGKPIQFSQLPAKAQTFVNTHYSKDKVVKVEKDREVFGDKYDVDFQSGAEVEFDSEGNWIEVKAAHGFKVPSAILPKAISDYIARNHEGLDLREIQKKRDGYEIELSNGHEYRISADAKSVRRHHD